MELQVNFSSPVVTNQHEGDNARHNPREANPETSRGPNSLSSEPAHGVTPRERPRHGGIVASPVERLRAFWTRIEEDRTWANALTTAHKTEVDAQAKAFPRDRQVDFHLASRRISLEGVRDCADLSDLPDLFVALVILATLRKYGPRTRINLKNLSSLVENAHEILYGTSLCGSETTLGRRFKYLQTRYPELAAALLPGLVQMAKPAKDDSASEVFEGIDVLEDLIEQVRMRPVQRWILVDIRQNLVFVQGCADPYRCPKGIEIAHLCMVLNAYRVGGNSAWIKCSTLIEDMSTVHDMFFGARWEASPRTLARRFRLLAKSDHPLREYLVSEFGCCGGYALRPVWARSTAP